MAALVERQTLQAISESQRRWRELGTETGRFSVKRLAQSVELGSGVSKRLTDLVVDNLPPFVPEGLPGFQSDFHATHPTPLIQLGLMADWRLIDKLVPPGLELQYPEYVKPRDRKSWIDGMRILTEVTTELLTLDVIRSLAEKHLLFRPFVATEETTGYRDVIAKTKELLGGEERFERIRNGLTLSMLSGDNLITERALYKNYYIDLNRIAILLGERIPLPKHDHFSNSLQGGLVHAGHPGVINIPLGHEIAQTAAALEALEYAAFGKNHIRRVGALALGAVLGTTSDNLGIPHYMVHEICHYMSQDSNRVGLIPYRIK